MINSEKWCTLVTDLLAASKVSRELYCSYENETFCRHMIDVTNRETTKHRGGEVLVTVLD
jgi:hypothetical protein